MTAARGFIGEANAYVLEGPKWGSNPVFQLELGSPGYTLSDGNTSWNTAAAPALSMWNQVIGRIQLGQVVGSTIPVSSGDGYNSMSFATTVFGKSFGSNTLAVTYYTYSSSSMDEADILFNRAQSWNSYRGPLRFNANGAAIAEIQRVALHELGHAIGLNHPDDAGQTVDAIMNSKISDRYTLSSDDIAGAQALYGAPSSQSVPSSNILWQDSITGDRQIWVMKGTVHTGSVGIGRISTAWNIAAYADFNGDGKRDILWQNSVTGQCTVWLLNGTSVLGGMGFPTVPPPWRIATASDFNGDGKPDVVLQNLVTGQRVIWLMNRTTFVSSVNLGVVPASFTIVGSGDFNGDGKSDILWQNNVTGWRSMWLMNGTTHVSSLLFATVPTSWSIVGTGDFNGDGKRDILWQNQTTGLRVIWLMNRTTPASGVSLGAVPLEWNIRNY
ncbi:MAG TPA: FG-GAP-like repeat-containing protein [Chthoniobacterales bacterium]|nr:FG-GAP-like repeat-containing protein [Chthoniobacterales bacterium]